MKLKILFYLLLTTSIFAGGVTVSKGTLSNSQLINMTYPNDITGLQLSLDAQDLGSITKTGTDVTQWSDKSGFIHHMIGSSGTEPTYDPDGINGKPAIYFNGSNDFLQTTLDNAPLADGDDSYTYVIVWRPELAGVKTIYEQNHATVVVGRRAGLLMQTGPQAFGYNGQGNDWMATVTYNIYSVYCTVMVKKDAATNNVVVYKNGVAATGSVNNTTANVSNDYAAVGYKISAPSEYFKGWVGEILVYNKELSTSEINAILDYTDRKWRWRGDITSGIPGLRYWMDSSEATKVITSASAVTNIEDKSDYLATMTQTDSAKRLDYTETVNGLNVMTAAVGDTMNTGYTFTASNTIFLICTETTGTEAYIWTTNASSSKSTVISKYASKDFEWYAGTERYTIKETASAGLHLIIIERVDDGMLKIWFDGDLVVNTTALGTEDMSGRVMTFLTATSYGGQFAEMGIYNRIISDAERNALTTSKKSKWGIS